VSTKPGAGHYSDEVLKDAINAFPLLEVGGVMIFDDYFWGYYVNRRENPMHAINTFLQYQKLQYQILAVTSQMVIQKIAAVTPAVYLDVRFIDPVFSR
jgi:hypothetical protein